MKYSPKSMHDHQIIRKCSVCGKTFIPTYGWVYKDARRGKWYCKYSCMREDTKDYEFKNMPTTPYTY